MDDSDLDFTDLCSRLLKRVRRKGGDEKKSGVRDEEPSPPRGNPPKRRKKCKDVQSEVKSNPNNGIEMVTHPGDVSKPAPAVPGPVSAKDVVIRRMQQFKRAGPEKLLRPDTDRPPSARSGEPSAAEVLRGGDVSGDEVLALQLQEEMDRESRPVADDGLFFCQLCRKDLSAVSPQLRTQHINRCLDAGEVGTPSTSHSGTHVPECPVCGKRFKSEKGRTVHLKRCSTSMGVPPNDLLQALRRQASETNTDQTRQTGDTKKRNGAPAKKKSRRKHQPLDEDTMVALALSRSLIEQEREKEREIEEERELQAQLLSLPATVAPVLQWKPAAGKGRGKRKKGASPVQPPLLVIQDPQTALNRLQERVSSLLLRSRSPSPLTPTFMPSSLPASSQAPLWLKSALHGGGPDSVSEFYTSELSDFIQPLIAPEKEKLKNLEVTPTKKPPAATTETALEECPDQIPAHHRSNPSPLSPCTDTPGTQALEDLMELAEEGMTLTQYGYTPNTPRDEDEAVNELPSSGFVPETNKTLKTASVSVSKLRSDLSSMVNNPQLSDVQLQVDSGDVFFSHSFMLYTRCPLLVNMVHDTGFGVQEEGMPASKRVLLGDVPGEAVLAFLQYLYTAQCPLTWSLLPHVRQLADKFSLDELQQHCKEYSESNNPRGESDDFQEPHLREQEDQNLAETNFLDLLQSMWQHEDSEEELEFKENAGEERGVEEDAERVDGEFKEDRVDEEEMNEIYEFAATQRKREIKMENATETEEEEGDAKQSYENEKKDGEIEKSETESDSQSSAASFHSNKGVDDTEAAIVTNPAVIHQNQNPEVSLLFESGPSEDKNLDVSLDKSYNRLFSQSVGEYTEPSPTPTSCQQHYKSSHTLQRNTPLFSPSCVSEVIDLSISPPLSSLVSGESSFPVPGVSPGPYKDEDTGQSEISGSNRNPPSPLESPSKQVELIVLSDSGDEMDVEQEKDGAPSPSKSCLKLSLESCEDKLGTRDSLISTSQRDTDKELNECIDNKPIISDSSEHHSSCTANQSIFDGSAEVSWLIPATPVPIVRNSSSQTSVSMRRTRLFPKSSSSSSSSSSVFDVPKNDCAGEKPELSSKLQGNCPLDSDQSPTKDHSTGYQTPLHHHKLSQITLKRFSDGSHSRFNNGHWTQSVPQPSSSTPLHSDSSLKQTLSVGQRKDSLLSLQLSQFDSSPAPCKTPERKKYCTSPQHVSYNLPTNSPRHDHPERSSENQDDGLEKMEVGDEDHNHNAEVVIDVTDINSPQASFCGMDEPPIAFDDSWDLNGGVGSQKPCFSLRLDSSEATVSPPLNESRRHAASQHATSPGAAAYIRTPDPSPGPFYQSLPDPDMWDDWEEMEEEPLPLSQRLAPPSVKRVAELKTPVACRKRNTGPLVPITPMPGYSDMDTPELKNRLNRFGVRPLPKKQMVLKLKEIHQYTHQVQSSESEEDTCSPRHPMCTSKSQPVQPFKQPIAPPAASPSKTQPCEEDELLSASQNSSSSTAESDRSNPELCVSEDDESDSEGITASQAVVREKDKLLAVRRFIMSDPKLYGRVLQYQPLPLAELRASLKAAGIRLGAAKLLDFLDSQCITFSTAKQGPKTSRRKQRRKADPSGPGNAAGRGRKKTAKPSGSVNLV